MNIPGVVCVAICFLTLGIAFGSHFAAAQPAARKPKRVTAIGGVFFKAADPEKLKDWYAKHLGLDTDQWGTNFEWRQADDGTRKGFTQWGPMKEQTKYFQPSEKQFMINYRVENLDRLLAQLKEEGITPVDHIDAQDYGKFVHLMDPEGNKIELWEPNDAAYDKTVQGRTM
jgi:predicted enzyme related to lactoylglutathione lyase